MVPTLSDENQINTKLLLGVSGGIAAYKTPELVRRLKELNFDVRVVLTSSAKNFVAPMSLQAVSGHPVLEELFDSEAEAAMSHIELAKWADVILIAPATANIIAKIAHGIADDLLTTLILASPARLIVAPAMNQQMWANNATKENVSKLLSRGVQLLGPADGEQACGDTGLGRMVDPMFIVKALVNSEQDIKSNLFENKNLLITAGPTLEPIDPVRYISNHSSGKMGFALAEQAALMGANVTLVAGPVNLPSPNNVERVDVVSANDMFLEVKSRLANKDIFIGCAAVADYSPENFTENKIKKNSEELSVKLTKTQDILSWVANQTVRPYVVGFAAESQNVESYAKDKLAKKNLDMICANDISRQDIGFNSDDNQILIITKTGKSKHLSKSNKNEIAKNILVEIKDNI